MEKKEGSVVKQVIISVVVALLVGSTAPWWWNELFSDSDSPGQPKTENNDSNPPNNNSPDDDTPGDTPGESADDKPDSDFEGGSRPFYTADIAKWPTRNTEHGKTSLGFGNSYVLEPNDNTWIGPGRRLEIPAIENDFVIDVNFRVEDRESNASLSFGLAGDGNNAPTLDLIFSVWGSSRNTYTLKKGRLRSGGNLEVPHVVTEEVIAERDRLPAEMENHDWSEPNELTLKRTGGMMQFFINDRFIRAFDVSLFPVRHLSLGAAWKSRIVITSIEARKPVDG